MSESNQKRKSFQKEEPHLPHRKISGHSRQDSKKKHRTQSKTLKNPEVQSKEAKKLNTNFSNELSPNPQNDQKINKFLVKTDRTKENSNYSEESSKQFSIHKVKQFSQQQSAQKMKQKPILIKQELTSRFTVSQNQHQQDSLTYLINVTKSKNSNPLINTARLNQQTPQQKGFYKSKERNQQIQKISHTKAASEFISHDKSSEIFKTQNSTILKNSQKSMQLQRIKQSRSSQSPQKEINDGQNFQNYEFGGENSNDLSENQSMGQQFYPHRRYSKSIMLPPKIQSYISNDLTKPKPQNWRQMNRYIPLTLQEHRMNQQVWKKQKASLLAIRQQQQLASLIKQYQQNKNSIRLRSQRKNQTNAIMQKIYREKRLGFENKQSLSLPQLKPFSVNKNIIIVAESQTVKNQPVDQILSVPIDQQIKHPTQRANTIKSSLSLKKFGFGSSKPRQLIEEEIKQSQIESIEKIQKKLRQKGLQFNTTSIKKGFLNLYETPAAKISTKNIIKSCIGQISSEEMLDLPIKQLPSNEFYKIFPI